MQNATCNFKKKKATIAQPTINLSSIFRGSLIPYNLPGSKNRINSHKQRAKHIPHGESIADSACLYSFIGSEAMLMLDKEYFPYDNDKIYWLSKSSTSVQHFLYIHLQLALHFFTSRERNGVVKIQHATFIHSRLARGSHRFTFHTDLARNLPLLCTPLLFGVKHCKCFAQ